MARADQQILEAIGEVFPLRGIERAAIVNVDPDEGLHVYWTIEGDVSKQDDWDRMIRLYMLVEERGIALMDNEHFVLGRNS